jgi:hypothetical protein
MRSPSSRRLLSRPPHHRPSEALVRAVDEAFPNPTGHLAFHLSPDPSGEALIGVRAIDEGVHPFSVLAGVTAPPEWSMFGLRVVGRAHHIDEPSEPPDGVPTLATFVQGRSGEEWSMVGLGGEAAEVTGPAQGTLPDLCRRVLGLPTSPPPSSTSCLWTVAWLDRVLEGWSDASRRRRLTRSWAEVAALHPAASGARVDADLSDPLTLVRLGRQHAREWPWSRLRADPGALPLPDGTLPAEITEWMDDGFYARWALGAFPSSRSLAHDLATLLDGDVAERLLSVLVGLTGAEPAGP